MVVKKIAEEHSREPLLRKALYLYMIIVHNLLRLVDTYLTMMNGIVFANLGKHVSAVIPLTWITTFQCHMP